MSLLRKKPAKPAPAGTPCRSKVLVALCALFTIAVPLAIIAAVVLPHLDGGGDANASTPDAVTPAPAAPVSATTPAPAAVTTSPSAPVSGTSK